MRILRRSALVLLALAAAASCATSRTTSIVSPAGANPASVSSLQLAGTWDRERVSWTVPPLIRHADVEALPINGTDHRAA